MAGNLSLDGVIRWRSSGGGRLGCGPSRLGVGQVDFLVTLSRLSLLQGTM